jgi:hypothetical protein
VLLLPLLLQHPPLPTLPPPPLPSLPYSDCFLTVCKHRLLLHTSFMCCRNKKNHRFRSDKLGCKTPLIILSSKAFCKQCAEFNYKTYHYSRHGIRICVYCWWEFMVSSNDGPDPSARAAFSLVYDLVSLHNLYII